MRKSAGFTMVELMMTIAVLAILVVFAVPNFTSFMKNQRLAGAGNEFISATTLARSEALRRAVPVVITATTATAGNEFGGGWKIWADLDSDATLDAGEPVIRQRAAFRGTVILKSLSGVSTLTFKSSGFLTPATSRQFTICDDRTGVRGQKITVSPVGMTDQNTEFTC